MNPVDIFFEMMDKINIKKMEEKCNLPDSPTEVLPIMRKPITREEYNKALDIVEQ